MGEFAYEDMASQEVEKYSYSYFCRMKSWMECRFLSWRVILLIKSQLYSSAFMGRSRMNIGPGR